MKFPNVSRDFCVFSHLTTPHNTHTIPHAFLSVSSGFQCFPTRTTPHNIHNTQPHTRTHACTPATDRYLARGLSKSVSVNARKNPRKCLKKAKSGETLAKARGDADGQIVRLRRSGERPMQPSSSWFPLKFLSFFRKKRMIRGLGHASFSTYSQTLKWARSCANSR